MRLDELRARGLALEHDALVARLRRGARPSVAVARAARARRRAFFVSGQEQQIFFPDLPTAGPAAGAGAGAASPFDASAPMASAARLRDGRGALRRRCDLRDAALRCEAAARQLRKAAAARSARADARFCHRRSAPTRRLPHINVSVVQFGVTRKELRIEHLIEPASDG